MTGTRTFPDPQVGTTLTGVTVEFLASQDIHLDAGQLGSDAFRLLTLSSMFAGINEASSGGYQPCYDANVLRWEDPNGLIHMLRLDDDTPRDQHLLPTATVLGPWFELIKEPGSAWDPTDPNSPCIRVDILGTTGITGRLGLQGFLAQTMDENDDSLNVWPEWIDAPDTINAGTEVTATFLVTATPPRVVVPPQPNWVAVVDDHWDNKMNWTSGARPTPSEIVRFGVSAPHQPVLHDDENVAGIEFASTGWTISGTHTLWLGAAGIVSTGEGSNTIDAAVAMDADSGWTIDVGNTVILSGHLSTSGYTLTKDGTGTLIINGPQEHAPGSFFEILGGTVDLNTNAGSPTAAALSILVEDAGLNFGCNQYLDTLTIGEGGLVRFTGANVVVLKHLVMGGVDLGATTLTPEPATLALLTVGLAAVVAVRRKR